MSLSVDLLWFGGVYFSALSQLRKIDRIYRTPVDIGELSGTMEGYLAEDEHLHNTLVALLNGMVSDWKATKVCVVNLTHFDSYVSHLINHESTGHMEYGCDALWRDGDVNEISFVARTNAQLCYPSRRYISSRSIRNLDLLCNKYEDTAIAIGRYITIVDGMTKNEDFSGVAIEKMKQYMINVHIPVANSLVTLLYAFISYIRSYQNLYNSTMSDEIIHGEYFIDVGAIHTFKEQISQSYRSLRAKIADFNQYVWYINSICEEYHLEAIANYSLDGVEPLVTAEISSVEELIRNNEENAIAGVNEIRSYINSIDNVVADLGMSTGYRMIYPNRQFDSISPLGNMRVQGDNVSIFDQLLSGSSSDRASAADSLRNDIINHLIGQFSNRNKNDVYYYFHYNEYRGYDDEKLRKNIDSLDFNDVEFVCRWRKLYNLMISDGYTETNALRFSAIAALYNKNEIINLQITPDTQESIILNGIRNYAVDYAGYIADTDKYGYNRYNRWAGDNDFDCSSLVIAGYEKAFIDLRTVLNYEDAGAGMLAGTDMDILGKYGFKELIPNVDVNVKQLVPGDIFAVDIPEGKIFDHLDHSISSEYMGVYTEEDGKSDEREISHAEIYFGKVENKGKTEYLTVSGHSSERIYGYSGPHGTGNGYCDESADQLQENYDRLTPPDGAPWGSFYKDFICEKEEGTSYNHEGPARGRDDLNHDRVGEIRFENIGPRDYWHRPEGHIEGYVFWHYTNDEYPVVVKWDRILRLDNMDFWKTYEVSYPTE